MRTLDNPGFMTSLSINRALPTIDGMLIKHVYSHFTKFVKTRFLAQKSGSQLRCRTMLKMPRNIQKTPPKHV